MGTDSAGRGFNLAVHRSARSRNEKPGHAGSMRIRNPATAPECRTRAPQQIDAPGRQPPLPTRTGLVGNHEVTPRERGPNLNLGRFLSLARAVPPRPGAAAAPTGYTPLRVLAAEQLSLDEGDAQSACRQTRSAVFAGDATPKDDDIVVIARTHGHLPGLLTTSRRPAASAPPQCCGVRGRRWHKRRVMNPKVELMSGRARSVLELWIEGGNAASKCGLHLTADIVCNYFEEILLDTVDGDPGDIRGV